MQHILFFIIAFFAEVVGTIAGFGSTTILTPLGSFLLDIKVLIVIVAFAHLFGNFFKIYMFRKVDWELFWKFGLISIIFSLTGAFLLPKFDTSAVKFMFGVFLVVFCGYSLFIKVIRLKANNFTAVTGGAVSGFFGGLIGTSGATRTFFMNAFSLPKDVYIATSAMIAIVIDIARIPVYFYGGISLDRIYIFYYLPLLFVIAFAGTFLGKKIVENINVEIFRKIILIALILVGLKLVFGV